MEDKKLIDKLSEVINTLEEYCNQDNGQEDVYKQHLNDAIKSVAHAQDLIRIREEKQVKIKKPEKLIKIITTPSQFAQVFESLGLEVEGEICEYCDEMVTPKNCGGIMPRLKGNTNFPVILCKKDVCMGEYINLQEELLQNA